MNESLTINDIRAAVEHNTRNGFHKSHPAFVRVYFSYVGGRYNGQRDDVASPAQMADLEQGLATGAFGVTDIKIISTNDAWRQFLTIGRA